MAKNKRSESRQRSRFSEMYTRVGLILHTLQMNEYNIANILALEEFEKEADTNHL